MKKIKIMRGISGSGKSTYARSLNPNLIVSADFFFEASDKTYHFDVKKLDEAHKSCMRSFLDEIKREQADIGSRPKKSPFIVVDNTNINLEDIAPYIAVGEAMGYDVEILQIDANPEIAAKRNVHGVPAKRVFDMHRRLIHTTLPRRWKITRITPEGE